MKQQRKPRTASAARKATQAVHKTPKPEAIPKSRLKLYQQLQADRRVQYKRAQNEKNFAAVEVQPELFPAAPEIKKSTEQRLQKIIASAGVCSRRQAEKFIILGKVSVNGHLVTELGAKANPVSDIISVDGKVINAVDTEKVYFVLNKPRGYVTTTNDPQGRATVMDLMPEISQRIYPVGRLDYASEGLLLFTNDGDMAHRFMHPSFGVTRTYAVKIRGNLSDDILAALRKGVHLAEGFVKPAKVWRGTSSETKQWIYLALKEGKNHEVRRIFSSLGMNVDRLRRVAIGSLTIDQVAVGKFRELSKSEIESVLRSATNPLDKAAKKKRKVRPHSRSRGL